MIRSTRHLPLALLTLTSPALAAQLEVTGELVASTCTVDGGGGAINVAMGKVDLEEVNSQESAGQKNFSIALDCSGSTGEQSVGLRFGGPVDGSSGNLALIATSSATNVGVAIFDASGKHQRVGEQPISFVTIPAQGKAELQYSVRYASPGKNATAGTANASGDFTIIYQ